MLLYCLRLNGKIHEVVNKMKKWLAIASILLLTGCAAPSGESISGFAASDEPVVESGGIDGDTETQRASSWNQDLSAPFTPLASVISSTPEGESGEWGNVVFQVKRVYQAASDRTCREVEIVYPDNPVPSEKLACGTDHAAFFATAIF